MDMKSTRATVLIVDDDPSNLAMLGGLLQPYYKVLASPTGAQALRIAVGNQRPDLILLDVMMPEMDGYQVLARLHDDPACRDIPVIFVTGMDLVADEEKGLELGAVDYIAKPFRPPIVLARVRTHLELKHARDRLKDQNAFLESEVARRMKENQIIQDASIHALGYLAETRDSETGDHIHRTQRYVHLLASRLASHPDFAEQLDAHAFDLLTKSAPLHDIGKVGIPDHVLLKPGPLDAEELAIMRRHTLLGVQAIEKAEEAVHQPVPFLAVAKQIARSHHERWDGTGYPDQLAGDDIPLPARLMALADVFDAIISPRIYKPAQSCVEARDIIVSQRGKQFDPRVVDAFLACFEDFVHTAQANQMPHKGTSC